MLRVGIVGAAGHVGRGLLHALGARSDLTVFGITRNAMSAGPLLADGLDIRVGSVADPARAPELLKGADVVINCALAIDRPKRARAQNEALLAGVLRHAHAGLVIHCSSVAVYGSCVDHTFSTFERPRPDATYGREKLRLERFGLREAKRRGQRLLVLRLGHLYGPGQGISQEAFDQLNARRWRLPFRGGLPSNALHIDQLADAIPRLAAMGDRESILNATDSPQRTWGRVYEMHVLASGDPPLDSMTDADALERRDGFRRAARTPLRRRLPRQVVAWARTLPLESLVNVTAVRQTSEAILLALPPWVEPMVDRRYAIFSASERLRAAASAGDEGPPPWYYSDAVPGPGLDPVSETEERTRREIDALRAWYESWAAPAWRVKSEVESLKSEV